MVMAGLLIKKYEEREHEQKKKSRILGIVNACGNNHSHESVC